MYNVQNYDVIGSCYMNYITGAFTIIRMNRFEAWKDSCYYQYNVVMKHQQQNNTNIILGLS